jgi:6-phosphofructokinase 1
MSTIKKIGVLTSGGDAPGMNAAIRSVVRTAIHHKLEVYGIYSGYKGMIEGDIRKLESYHVSGIIQNGGTILKTARSEEFRTSYGRKQAYNNLKNHNIDAVIVIGGDGSFTGASIMIEEYNIPFIGIPGTIDNDIFGTEYTIGFDTALNTVIDAVDKIRDTASSHDRIFFIEVMGKEAGFVALNSGIATGAEAIFIPEVKDQVSKIVSFIKDNPKRNSSIILVAEGDEEGSAIVIANKIKKQLPDLDARVTILGHIQRGGSPTCYDRVSACRMGYAAVEELIKGNKDVMIGLENDKIVTVPLKNTVKMHKNISDELLKIAEILV